MFQEKHLPKLIFLTPIVTIILLTLVILSFFISIERANLRIESEALEKQLLTQQKTTLSYEIQKVFHYFEYHMRIMRHNIDTELKDRVDDIHQIGINLFSKNYEGKTIQELRQDLLLTLSSLHVSTRRGYYFIVDAKGEIIYPQEELGDRIGLKNAVTEAIRNGGYASTEVGRPRRVYVKTLAAYEWSVGSAEYLDLATSKLKQEMIAWAESLRYGSGGYVWIHDTSHTLLAHPFRKESVGKDDANLEDKNHLPITKIFVQQAMSAGDAFGNFVEYFWPKPYETTPSKKISYVAFFKPWNWVVGTGAYVSDIEKTIAVKKEEMKAKMDRYILGVIVIALFSMMIVGFISLLITRQINEALESYRIRVQNQNDTLKEFNATLRIKINQALAESKRKDLALLHQSRLAQMGEMLSIIAHQWRQPLSEVSGIFMELETAAQFNQVDKEMILKSASDGDRLLSYMSRTIDDFRHFFKPSKERVMFDIAQACEEAFSLARATLNHAHISLHVSQHSSISTLGFPNEYAQVILNLLLNAKDAFVERGVQSPRIWVSIGLSEAGKSLVCVSDNAGGIDEALVQSIFEPYVSTKKASSGTGLGLYMAKMIIEDNMQGSITVCNTDDGAQFCIEV